MRFGFFSTEGDLKLVLSAIERTLPVDYVRMDVYESNAPERYPFGIEIPRLGFATSDSSISSDHYLVLPKNAPISAEKFRGDDGKDHYCFDQLANPETITFRPAGRWSEDILLYGEIGTAYQNEISKALMMQFTKGFRKSYRKIRTFWVGPEAMAMFENGARLTMAVQSPREYDLSRS